MPINIEELPKSDPIGLLGVNERIDRLPRKHGKAFQHFKKNTRQHTYYLDHKDLRVQALFDFWKFVDLINLQGGTKGFDPVFHKDLSNFVTQTQLIDTENRRRLGLVARGHAKTTLGSVAYTLWRIYRNPNIRIVIATNTKTLALQIVKEIKQYLENDKLQQEVWNNRPHISGSMIPILDKAGASRRNQKWELGDDTEAEDKKIVWRQDALQVIRDRIMKEPTILVASPKSSITGIHCDLVIMDDIINDETVATPEKRNKTLEWARDLESIVDPERTLEMGNVGNYEMFERIGREFVVWGTRYHLEDYYQFLLDNKEIFGYKLFYRNVYKNFVDNKEGYTWGVRFNDKEIGIIKAIQGLVRFFSQYLNIVRANEEVIFSNDQVQYFTMDQAIQDDKKPGLVKIHIGNDVRSVKLKLTIDPAISQSKKADYTSIAVGGMDCYRNLYIVDYVYGKWLPAELIKQTYTLMDKWLLTSAHVETVAYQAAIIPTFKDNFHLYRPISLIPYLPKGDKQARIQMYLEPIFKNGMFYITSKAKFDKELKNEIEYFPTVHDDIIDSFAMISEVCNPMSKKRDDSINHHYLGGIPIPEGSYVTNPKYGGRLR